MGKIRKSSG